MEVDSCSNPSEIKPTATDIEYDQYIRCLCGKIIKIERAIPLIIEGEIVKHLCPSCSAVSFLFLAIINKGVQQGNWKSFELYMRYIEMVKRAR